MEVVSPFNALEPGAKDSTESSSSTMVLRSCSDEEMVGEEEDLSISCGYKVGAIVSGTGESRQC